jgi:hypothetical protein
MEDLSVGSLFQFDTPPSNPEDLPGYLADHFFRLQAVVRALAQGNLDELHAAPERVYTGLLVLADGTDWDPGSGQGVYCYYGGAWNLLG